MELPLRLLARRLPRSVAVAVIALAAALAPLTPAHATYGTALPVNLQVTGEYGQDLASVRGTLQFDDGGTAYKYSLTLCRHSSFTAPRIRIYVNSAYQDLLIWSGGSSASWCAYSNFTTNFNAQVDHGSTVHNIKIELMGSSFPSNVYTEHFDDSVYYSPYD
jgi:hypothetical protein